MIKSKSTFKWVLMVVALSWFVIGVLEAFSGDAKQPEYMLPFSFFIFFTFWTATEWSEVRPSHYHPGERRQSEKNTNKTIGAMIKTYEIPGDPEMVKTLIELLNESRIGTEDHKETMNAREELERIEQIHAQTSFSEKDRRQADANYLRLVGVIQRNLEFICMKHNIIVP